MKGGIGIDISNGTVTVAVLRAAKQVTLDAFVVRERPVPQEGETARDALGRGLSEAWRQHKLQGLPVAACLEARDCILRELVVPFQQEDRIRRTIRFEAENYLHACAIEDVVVDFLKTDSVGAKSGILLAAGRKDMIQRRLDLFKAGGIDPEILDLDVIALFNAFKETPQFREEGQVIVLDIGTDTVRMLLVAEGALRKVRAFRVRAAELAAVGAGSRLGSPEGPLAALRDVDPLDELEARFAAIDLELARAGDTSGDGEDVPIAVLDDGELAHLREDGDRGREGPAPLGHGAAPLLFDRILAEAQRTFASVLVSGTIDAVFLTGPGSRLAEAESFFRERFEADTERLDFTGILGDGLDAESAEAAGERGAVALGLALRAAGRDEVGLDFRQGEFRYQQRFAKLRVPLLVTGLLLFTSVLFNCLYLAQEKQRFARTYHNVREAQADMYRATFKADPDRRRSVLRQLAEHRARMEVKFKGGAGVPEYVPILELLEDLGAAVRQAGVPNMVWQKIDVKTEIPPKAGYMCGRFDFLADSITAANRVQAAISQHSRFLNGVQPGGQEHKPSGRVACKVDLEFKDALISRPPASRSGTSSSRTPRGL